MDEQTKRIVQQTFMFHEMYKVHFNLTVNLTQLWWWIARDKYPEKSKQALNDQSTIEFSETFKQLLLSMHADGFTHPGYAEWILKHLS